MDADGFRRLVKALDDLIRDCLASDFNEHWESFKNAEAALVSAKEHIESNWYA